MNTYATLTAASQCYRHVCHSDSGVTVSWTLVPLRQWHDDIIGTRATLTVAPLVGSGRSDAQ